ncbi:MAG: VanW family protein [Lawsonibacter sp.]
MKVNSSADPHGLRTKRRSALRLKLGSTVYSAHRHALWLLGRYNWASRRQGDSLPHLHMAHRTPLMRQLRDVEMVYQRNKAANLKLAAARLDGLVLGPGQVFSYWKLIGRPTYGKGYLDGVLLRGGRVCYGCGGGLCQLSNLIFWMTIHTPLKVIERHRHGYDVFPDSSRTQPFGSGATCFYPYGDLMIQNPTGEPFQLRLRVGEEYLEGEWRSASLPMYRYQIVERGHEMRHEWWGGCSRYNRLYRQTFTLEGDLIEDVLMVENHAMMMYDPFLEEPKGGGGSDLT